MRLIRIAIDAYQCIEHAEVEFGPGLNVLYGPNDLGKTTLAGAIRDVLLLPPGAAAAEPLISWHSGDRPHVSLTFTTEPQRIWRVTKTFGSGSAGSSLLEFSKDGLSFAKEANGRQVDEKVRALLRWGIGQPGGKGAGRGVPDSFLTNVLLGNQFDVAAILDHGLAEDAHESGRERLNEALQALAQDPVFKRILDVALEQVDLAFTSTGQRSRRKGSPFIQVTDEIRELQARQRELQTKLNETVSAEEGLRRLHGELDGISVELAEAEEHLRVVQDAAAQAAARAAVEAESAIACGALATVRQELAEIDEAARDVEALRVQLAAADTKLVEATQAAALAAQTREAALQRLQEVASESGAQARQLAQQQLENDRLRAEGRRTELVASLAAAEVAERRGEEASRARQALDDVGRQLAEAERALGTCAEAEREASTAIGRLATLESFARLHHARCTLDAVEADLVQAKADLEAAAGLRGQAEQLERQGAELGLPDAETVARLARLAQDLAVAEARLGGGLSVVVTPLSDVRLRVAADGAPPGEHQGREPLALDAQRSLDLQVGDLAQISITAGEAAARSAVERLRASWAADGEPVLRRAGVPTPAALTEARQRADALQAQALERRAAAARMEERARQQEKNAEGVEGMRTRVADLEHALTGRDHAELAERLAALGDAWETAIERQRAAAEKSVRDSGAALQGARDRFGDLKAKHSACEVASKQAATAAAEALAALPGDAQTVLQQGRAELAAVERAVAELGERIATLSQTAADEQVEAQRGLDAVVARLDAATEAVHVAQEERDTLRDALARASGSLDARRTQAQRLDLEAAAKAVEDVSARLSGMAVPAVPCAAADLASAAARVERARSAVADKRGAIHRAQGALEQVGGAVVRDQVAEIDRALQLALGREHGVEVEYEAWRLLADTLREVENSDGAHLGRALAGPLAERFAALTGGRYGAVSIDQELQLADECIEAGGQLRSYDELSAGTQDQLATLFRLCIAEQLDSAIVLDDHLSQSDPDKIRWFRDRLRQSVHTIQVIVITCRPEDYLLPDEFPAAGEMVRDRAGGSLRAIDLAQVIRRYALGADPDKGAQKSPEATA